MTETFPCSVNVDASRDLEGAAAATADAEAEVRSTSSSSHEDEEEEVNLADLLCFEPDGVPARLSDFTIEGRIGQRRTERGFYGCNSAVYLASLNTHPDQPLAIKVIYNLEGNVESYLQEADILAKRPDHPGVMKYLYHFTDNADACILPEIDRELVRSPGQCLFLVMEYIELSLSQIIRSRHQTEPPFFETLELVDIAFQLISSVAFLHEQQVVHRDLKPDNVLVKHSPRAQAMSLRVTDFGLGLDARRYCRRGFRLSYEQPHQVLGGAPWYLPPEVLEARAGAGVTIDYSKCDIFSVGMILYEMVASERPWMQRTRTAESLRPLPEYVNPMMNELIVGMVQPEFSKRLTAAAAKARITSIVRKLHEESKPTSAEPSRVPSQSSAVTSESLTSETSADQGIKRRSLGEPHGQPLAQLRPGSKSLQWKLVVLGDSHVGKSSLVVRFTEGHFVESVTPTIGAAYFSRAISYQNQKATLHVWDTAGQERFRSFTKSYYRGAACALIVYDVTFRQSFEHATMWMQDLIINVDDPDLVIVVVGNKTDAPGRVIPAKEAEAFTQTYGDNVFHCECSAKTGEGVDELFGQITAELFLTQQHAQALQGQTLEVLASSLEPERCTCG